jgi:hypothetical protein
MSPIREITGIIGIHPSPMARKRLLMTVSEVLERPLVRRRQAAAGRSDDGQDRAAEELF